MDGHDADNSKQSTGDMTAFVQNLLQQMVTNMNLDIHYILALGISTNASLSLQQTRFQTMSESIITKIDEMGNRIDELEQSINDLRGEMGQEGTPSKSGEDPKSAEDS